MIIQEEEECVYRPDQMYHGSIGNRKTLETPSHAAKLTTMGIIYNIIMKLWLLEVT